MNIRLQFVYIKVNNRSILPGIKALEKQNETHDIEYKHEIQIHIHIYLYHLKMASTPLAASFCADMYEFENIFLQLLVRKIYFKTLSIKMYVCLHKVNKIFFP